MRGKGARGEFSKKEHVRSRVKKKRTEYAAHIRTEHGGHAVERGEGEGGIDVGFGHFA